MGAVAGTASIRPPSQEESLATHNRSACRDIWFTSCLNELLFPRAVLRRVDAPRCVDASQTGSRCDSADGSDPVNTAPSVLEGLAVLQSGGPHTAGKRTHAALAQVAAGMHAITASARLLLDTAHVRSQVACTCLHCLILVECRTGRRGGCYL
jgi:hypothetical protein